MPLCTHYYSIKLHAQFVCGKGEECEVWGKEGYGVREGMTRRQNAINDDLQHRITAVNSTHHYALLSQPGLHLLLWKKRCRAGPVGNTVI